jgi:hypothetical protein
VPVHRVEVFRAREPVTALHRRRHSGGEALAPPGTPALEDRPASTRRHPRSEAVPALAAADIRLVGAFHVAREVEVREVESIGRNTASSARALGRAGSIDDQFGGEFSTRCVPTAYLETAAKTFSLLPET